MRDVVTALVILALWVVVYWAVRRPAYWLGERLERLWVSWKVER